MIHAKVCFSEGHYCAVDQVVNKWIINQKWAERIQILSKLSSLKQQISKLIFFKKNIFKNKYFFKKYMLKNVSQSSKCEMRLITLFSFPLFLGKHITIFRHISKPVVVQVRFFFRNCKKAMFSTDVNKRNYSCSSNKANSLLAELG